MPARDSGVTFNLNGGSKLGLEGSSLELPRQDKKKEVKREAHVQTPNLMQQWVPLGGMSRMYSLLDGIILSEELNRDATVSTKSVKPSSPVDHHLRLHGKNENLLQVITDSTKESFAKGVIKEHVYPDGTEILGGVYAVR